MAITSAWNRRTAITVDHTKVLGDRTYFPVLICWNGTNGNIPAEVYNSGGNSPLASGADIRFSSDINGANELAFDIVTFTPNSTVANARVEIWVAMTWLSSSSDTVYYMWWKNPSASAYAVTATYGRNATWNQKYIAVWHMNEGNVIDASGNGYNGTNNGTTAATTIIGTARHFTVASSNSITIGGTELMGTPASLSISALSNFTTVDNAGSCIWNAGDCARLLPYYGGQQYFLRTDAGYTVASSETGSAYPRGQGLLYYHGVCSPTQTGSTELYINGTSVSWNANTSPLNWGSQGIITEIGTDSQISSDFHYGGDLDEIRICNGIFDAERCATDYNTAVGFATFQAAAAPVNVGSGSSSNFFLMF